MSAKATAKVWEHSRSKGNEKLLLLAYADYAKDDGTGACPSAKTLAAKTGLDERSILNIRSRVIANGELHMRTERSEYGTPICDIAYGDGSNAAVIRTLHGEGGKNLPPPEKSSPDSVVVSSPEMTPEDSPEETTTRSGENFSSPRNIFPLLARWSLFGLDGEWLHGIAAAILDRPNHEEELADLERYYQTWNQYAAPEKTLGPAWLASQYKALAQMSPNTDREFHWMDHAPTPSGRGEAWRSYTAETEADEFELIRRKYGGYQTELIYRNYAPEEPTCTPTKP
jgi:hypothetical protein